MSALYPALSLQNLVGFFNWILRSQKYTWIFLSFHLKLTGALQSCPIWQECLLGQRKAETSSHAEFSACFFQWFLANWKYFQVNNLQIE